MEREKGIEGNYKGMCLIFLIYFFLLIYQNPIIHTSLISAITSCRINHF
jgi:hypothetical protein